jgi:hypothetical protein
LDENQQSALAARNCSMEDGTSTVGLLFPTFRGVLYGQQLQILAYIRSQSKMDD